MPVFLQLFDEGDKFTSAEHFSERALERVSPHNPVSLTEAGHLFFILSDTYFLCFTVLLLQNWPMLSFFMIPALKAAPILDVAMLCAVEVRNAKPGNHLNQKYHT